MLANNSAQRRAMPNAEVHMLLFLHKFFNKFVVADKTVPLYFRTVHARYTLHANVKLGLASFRSLTIIKICPRTILKQIFIGNRA